jgi:hypothetical protein
LSLPLSLSLPLFLSYVAQPPSAVVPVVVAVVVD